MPVKVNKSKNVRTINGRFQVRDASTNDDGSHVISGYAVVFNQASEDLGGFIEFISPQAFEGVDMSDVLLLFNHNFDNTLARVTAGSLTLSVDDTGLAFQATLPNTQLGNDTFTNIQNGNYQGCSFGFTIGDDTWDMPADETIIHTITQVDRLFEISICPLPAYTETSVNIERSLEKLTKEEAEKRNKEEAKNEGIKVEDFRGLLESVKNIGREVKELRDQKTKTDPKDEDDSNTDEKSTKSKVTKKSKRDDDEPLEQDGLDKHVEGEKRNLAKDVTPKPLGDEKEKKVRGFINYLKSKGQTRDNVTTASDGNGAVIPTQILNVQKVPNDPANLAQYINRQAVTAPSGDLPILKKNNARMVTKAELAANPDLAFQGFEQVSYKLQTYAGVIPVSYEAMSDMKQVDIQNLVSQGVSDSRDLTENDKIGAVLQKAAAVAATSADDLKDAYNKGLSYYNRMIICTETAYADIDKLKDNQGRYLFQDSITASSGKQLFGAPVVVVPDTVLGAAGDAKLFIGDPKAFVLETYKDEVSASWVDNDIWGTKLAAYLRADFNVADSAAGKFVTFTPATGATGK